MNLRILIVEDEPPIAADIEEYTKRYFGDSIERLQVEHTFTEAMSYLDQQSIDLCLLDLNLGGKSGFDILHSIVSRNFHTIIISAYTEKAIEAFRVGILDFVPKPIDRKRLELAFERFAGRRKTEGKGVESLVVRKMGRYFIIPIEQVLYFKADRYLVELHQRNGKVDLLEKSLNRLEQILPDRFSRVHRSYICDIQAIQSYRHKGSGIYMITLDNGEQIPLSGERLKALKSRLQDSSREK